MSAPAGSSYAPVGALSFQTASEVHAAGLRAISRAGSSLLISLAAVTQVDSAGLAVLLDWMREARTRGCALRFADLPPGALRLAAISEVDALLHQASEPA
ncbi:MAG: STAS domain-containing protein [Steroidobacteraceae bacterium]